MKMRKLLMTLLCAAFAMGLTAQNDIQLGKKWFDAERYDKALPYLVKATAAGDADSKARLATMIFTMQVPSYSMDRAQALAMLDEAIAAGSVLAIERKGFCTLNMGNDTKEDKLKGIALLKEAADKGSADASFSLFKAYRDGIYTYSDHQTCLEPDDAQATAYARKAFEQGGLEGKAYVGLFTFEGSHGFTRDEGEGIRLMTEAMQSDTRLFAGNCLEPGKALVTYLKANGQADKVTTAEALLKKFHPTEF